MTPARRTALFSLLLVSVAAAVAAMAIATQGSSPPPMDATEPFRFVDATFEAGLAYPPVDVPSVEVSTEGEVNSEAHARWMGAAGVAAGDYDGDGWVDLYVTRGEGGETLLFRNVGDGTFVEDADRAGVALDGEPVGAPVFGDADGDGRLDLLVGGVEGTPLRMFHNNGDGTFELVPDAGLENDRNVLSCSFADHDGDRDLDLFCGRWTRAEPDRAACSDRCAGHVWTNDGNGRFAEADSAAGVLYDDKDWSFTPNVVDVNGDNWPDLLMAGDFGTSRVFENRGDGTFRETTDRDVINDQNGMGASVGDYDNDGDVDWFVTSIYVEDGYRNGNRLYRGLGDGTFEETSEDAGVRAGHWGWASCFADFDNDGALDIFHVNGWEGPTDRFLEDPSRLFMNEGPPTWRFTERSEAHGLADTRSGRGVVCFDYDRDGDVDILVANAVDRQVRLYRNDGGNARNFLGLKLEASGGIPTAVGASVEVAAGESVQLRVVQAGSNFASQQPLDVHVGLAAASVVDEIRVTWPDRTEQSFASMGGRPIEANQFLVLRQGEEEPQPSSK